MNGWKLLVGSLVRNGLVAFFSALVAHHIITKGQADTLPVNQMVVGILGDLSVLGWSLYQKVVAHWKFLAALQTPPPVDPSAASDTIASVSKQTSPGVKLAALVK